MMKLFFTLCVSCALVALFAACTANQSANTSNAAYDLEIAKGRATSSAIETIAHRSADAVSTNDARTQTAAAAESTRAAQAQLNAMLYAQATSTTQSQQAIATSTAQYSMARAAETAQVERANFEATQTARAADATATSDAHKWQTTATAEQRTLEAQLAHAQATQTAEFMTLNMQILHAQATATAEALDLQAKQDEGQEPIRAALKTAFWGVLILALIVFIALGGFLLWRLWMLHDQKNRIVEKGNQVIVIAPGNLWGSNPQYKVVDAPPQTPALAAPTQTEVTDEAFENAFDPSPKLQSKHLNLAEQPLGLYLPFGVTKRGDKWIALAKAGHVLIAGQTGSGKTYLVHALIQSLLYRGLALLVLCDGKRGIEFARYATDKNVRLVGEGELDRALTDVLKEMARRYDLMLAIGVRDIESYNAVSDDNLQHLIVVIDELKEIGADALAQVVSLMRIGRAAGIYLIVATQFPDAKSIPLDVRGNAATRVAFAVKTYHESIAILGNKGAEDLAHIPGRVLVDCGNERFEAQTFLVDLPNVPIVTTPPSPFSTDEKKMIELALSEGGWFKVKKIARALGINDALVTATAEAWERRGWLSKEQVNVGRPGKNGRQVLPVLEDLARQHGVLGTAAPVTS